MIQVIAKKRIGRKKPGDTLRMTKVEARAAVALGLVAYRTTALSAPVAAQSDWRASGGSPAPVKRTYRTKAKD